MAEFNLHIRLDAEQSDSDEGVALLETYAEKYDGVTLETEPVDSADTDSDTIVLAEYLEIEGIEVFADIYTALQSESAVYDMSLWGPTSERFPVPVQHYALQQTGNPKLYEFHALDGQVTLVVAESHREMEQLRRDIPTAALE